MKNIFLKLQPDALITKIQNSKGDFICFVNGQVAFNYSDVYNSENWIFCMKNAYQRSFK